ncbi:MAG: amidohydrolase [Chloroflexi bacterium]|nr:amidohydrolase [Chloroflexota bacterium]
MLDRAHALADEMSRLRREIHKYPELAFEEVRTAALVAETLREIGGIEIRTQVGKTGVVGDLGFGDGPTIAIRADMDALPLTEATGLDHASTTAGKMHACGHDAHTAILLGVAHLLKQEFASGQLKGRVRFLFQPAEELGGDGVSGAPLMMKDGALEGVDHAIALHVVSEMPLGQAGMVRGPVTAAGDGFRGIVKATGGHGAYPHLGGDPIAIAASVVQALNAIVSRKMDPMYPAVCSLGVIRGGAAFNVIPAEVELAGTLRSFDPAIREQLFAEVEKAFALAKAMGGDYTLELQRGYPPGINDATVAQWMDDVASGFLGADAIDRHTVGMAGEDFAYMQQQVPGAMLMLGASVGDMNRPHHTPVFDIDERCMPIGAAILAETVRRYLRQHE